MIGKLTVLFFYIQAFMTTVVPNCLHPEGWKYCYRVDEWLFPAIVEGYEMWRDPCPYCEEKEILSK